MVRQKRTWSDSELTLAVKNGNSIAAIIDILGLVKGGSYKSIKAAIDRLQLDTSHFITHGNLDIARATRKVRTKEEIFIENGGYSDYKRVKEIIIRESLLPYECSNCDLIDWLNQPLSLQLDHKNGNRCDNRLENLRFLCPNCHSQTPNFCGRNRKTEKKQYNCISCGKKISKSAVWCKPCVKKTTKINSPSIEELLSITQKFGFSETGRKLGVSDVAVKKHLIRYSEK